MCFDDNCIVTMIKLGCLDPDLRLNYWISQSSFFEFESQLKKKYNIGSLFQSAYEHIKNNVKARDEDKLNKQINADLKRSTNSMTG